jgi:hypothetical protein
MYRKQSVYLFQSRTSTTFPIQNLMIHRHFYPATMTEKDLSRPHWHNKFGLITMS